MIIDKRKVIKSVMFSWIHTIMALLVMLLVMSMITYIGFRFGKPQLIMGLLGGVVLFSTLIFFLSEYLVVIFLDAKKVDKEKYPLFPELVEELCLERKMFFRPRLYTLDMGVPNAMAFGPGFLGQYAIAITPEIYKLMNRNELKSILAHELAHIRCKDVGLNSVLSVFVGGAEKIARIFITGKMGFKGPLAYLIGGIFYFIAKVVFPIGHNAISQEREKSADALGALYVGTSKYLISALKKLDNNKGPKEEKTIVDQLFISHPNMDYRIACLEGLTKEKGEKSGKGEKQRVRVA